MGNGETIECVQIIVLRAAEGVGGRGEGDGGRVDRPPARPRPAAAGTALTD